MNLTDLSSPSGGNPNGAGLTQRLFIALASTYPKTVETLENNRIVTISTGPTFALFEASRTSGKFKVTSSGDTDAKTFAVEMEYFIPNITPEKSNMLSNLVNYPCVVISEDRKGNLRRCGWKYDGVEFDFEEMTEGKNGYLLKAKIEGLGSSPAFVDNDTIIPRLA
jgi:hypothetical protein